jgi:hypothetical protein
MDLNDMLAQQQLWLDKAHQALTAVTAGDGAPIELTQPRIEYIQARIAELARQKDQEAQRYDTAIADLNSELAGLTAETPLAQGTSPPAAKAAKKQTKKRAAKARTRK